ncbi:outer membrane protein TolC [Dysgonomonas alginatilytica]|uniref:Outer membrane protein TolC n=1 Tax=Dysgonomonas alginatilytica TaxID=1605892 RepID=A0A2V3PLT3_9BACT|nr:TolC family protein [Dysgonomonas alginatilytica]PXV61117.1 outer membrane protein TolC [Dysgonomonas alginatilytica]
MGQVKIYTLLVTFYSFFPLVYGQGWQLDRCLVYAKENNKELLANSQNIRVAGFDKKVALSQFVPEVSLSAEMDYYWKIPVQSYPGELVGKEEGTTVAIPIGTPWMGNYGVNVNWKILNMEAWQEIKVQNLKSQASKYNYQSLSKLLDRNVTAAYYSVQIQRINVETADERLRMYRHINSLLFKQFDAGIIDKISLNQSQSILNQYVENQIKVETDFQKSLLDLKFWMSYPLDELLSISDIENIPSLTNESFSVHNLPNYEEQQHKVNIEEYKYKSLRSSFYPKLSFTSNLGQMGFGDKFNDFKRSSSWYTSGFVGLRLQIPLFSLADINSAKRQKAIAKQASMELSDYEERETKNFRQIVLETNKTLKVLDKLNEVVKLAEENERLCQQKIEQGIIDMLQLKQIQQDLIESQERLNTAKLNYLKNYVELNYLQSNRIEK